MCLVSVGNRSSKVRIGTLKARPELFVARLPRSSSRRGRSGSRATGGTVGQKTDLEWTFDLRGDAILH